MASRGPGVLESTSLTSLNAINNGLSASSLPPSKRRKIFHTDDAELPATTQTIFTVKGHASSLSDNEFRLAPIELLPRSALPFSWLDTSTAMQSSNIFASNDEALEQMLCSGGGEGQLDHEPKVLATRLLSTGATYVVEQVKRGIFAMTKLQSSIEEGEIRVAAKAAAAESQLFRVPKSSVDLSMTNTFASSWDWREAARLPGDIPPFESFAKRSKFDVSVVFESYNRTNPNPSNNYEAGIDSQVSIRDSFMAFDNLANSGIQEHIRTPPEDGTQASMLEPEHDAQGTPPTPDVIMENLRTQYLEALYISKTSVAYFAKGPLTRCRNAFSQANLEGSEGQSLPSQYRESILSVKKMDAKYREAIPMILRNATLLLSDEERPKKRKGKKNKKLGKNGLYSGEDEFLQKYWKSRRLSKNKEGEQESKEQEVKRHVSELRLRETQLQILLILETVHIESSSSASSPTKDGKGREANEPNAKRSKSKKGEDLNLLLELLIDRLCIWHAVSAGEGIIQESIKETSKSHLSGKKIESDALRDFCTEVIIPFYASRLPDQCKVIKKKLGGASEISPSRPVAPPKLKSSSSSLSSSKGPSGAVDSSKKTQSQHQRSRRSLQRFLTDDQAAGSQRTRHPSLMRSSTTPALQEVKRESVEPSLPKLGGSVRGGLHIARRADNREVDLNAVARQHESKIKKMNTLVEQKKELDAAISALRKPNRELVSKEVADQAEKRTTSSRKPKNPVRNPLGQGVQVMATPRGSRKKDMSADQSHLPSRPFLARPSAGKMEKTSPEMERDVSVIPGSTIRANVLSSTVTSSKRKLSSIVETPSRGASRRSDPLDTGDHDQIASVSTPVSTMMSIPCTRALFKVPTLPPPTIPRSIDERLQPKNSSNAFKEREEAHDPDSDDRNTSMKYRGNNISPEMTFPTTATINETPPAKGKTQSFFFSRQLSATNTVASSSPAPVFETPIKARGGVGDGQGQGQSQAVQSQSTPVKSIYDQLGWDDDDDDDDELAF